MDEFKRGYQAGGDAYRQKAGQWSNWIAFFLALVVTEIATRGFSLKWYASLLLIFVAFLLLSFIVALVKKKFTKSPPA